MFQSATVKLTGWYLLILMIISLVFSAVVFNLSSREVDFRLERLQSNLTHTPMNSLPPANTFRRGEDQKAADNLLLDLLYANLIILVGGGVGSYILARRTLRPIEEAHEAQSRFTSDASHELRTPLATMKTEIEATLRDRSADTTELREVLTSNLEEIERLTRLSDMLLSLSRMEHSDLERHELNLYDVTLETLGRFNQPKSRLKLESKKGPNVDGNDAALHDLIAILIDNALKYSPAGSQVTIRLSSGGAALFSISNFGAGIDPEKLPHIFDRFYRADSSRSARPTKGYGLGLALAKKIVDLHGGELRATSVPGHKTTFSFTLPIFRQTQAKAKH